MRPLKPPHPILASMVSLCLESLKLDNGNANDFAAAFADRYGAEMQRLEMELIREMEKQDDA